MPVVDAVEIDRGASIGWNVRSPEDQKSIHAFLAERFALPVERWSSNRSNRWDISLACMFSKALVIFSSYSSELRPGD